MCFFVFNQKNNRPTNRLSKQSLVAALILNDVQNNIPNILGICQKNK